MKDRVEGPGVVELLREAHLENVTDSALPEEEEPKHCLEDIQQRAHC